MVALGRLLPLPFVAAAGALVIACAVPTPDGWVQGGDTAAGESSSAGFPPIDGGGESSDAAATEDASRTGDGGRIARAIEQRKAASAEADSGSDAGLKDAGSQP